MTSLCRVVRAKTFLLAACAAYACLGPLSVSLAQVSDPDRKTVFSADTRQQKQLEQQTVKKVVSGQGQPAPGVDFQAPIIEFDRNANRVVGKGGVTISEGGVQVQADEGSFDTEKKIGDVKGRVLVSSSAGVLAADAATFEMSSETGEFTNIDFETEEGGFHVLSDKARKVSEFEFELEDSSFTSCHCADGDRPWEMKSSTCSITQEGYAHTYGSKVYFEGVPVFYSPYLAFPVKNERASGLLAPQWGISNQDGFMFRQPVLGIVDDSTDFTLTPFIASKSRVGSELELQKVFSKTSQLRSGLIYSNESMRGQNLRGLNINGVSDPTIDQSRLGGYYKHRWTPDPKLGIPMEFVADGRYTSDNLMLREIPEPDIGDKQSQFLTSTAVLRGVVAEALQAEARAEYNQMLITDQDVQTQRLPELALSTGKTFRPFGQNPYGAKLVTNAGVVGTDFVRQDGYDGWRYDVQPRAAVPFHVSNYFRGQFSAEVHQTEYDLNSTAFPTTPTPTPKPDSTPSTGPTPTPAPLQYLDSTSYSRTLPIFGYGMSTGVERVYQVDRSSWLSRLASYGAKNEKSELVRMKHTIEPNVQYTYIPDVDQDNNPLFDQLDRYRHRSLVAYGFNSRIYGRFMEPYERTRSVEELAAAGETLPMVDLGSSMLDFGRNMVIAPSQNVDVREGEIRQLAMFSVKQSYDFVLASNSNNSNNSSGSSSSSTSSPPATSDLNLGVSLSPSSYFSTGFQTNYHTQDSTFSSYGLSLGFMDDREDMLRARYTFVDQSVQQLEANLEVALHARFRAGGYVRYDADKSEVIESRGLLRFINSCRCWSADVGVGQTINPDRKMVLFTFTFGGLGGITQGVGLPQQGAQQ